MERARTGSHDDEGAQADTARPAAGAVEGLLAFQRAAGNRATGRLLRTLHNGKRAIPTKQVAAIEKKLRADLGTGFPQLSWNVNTDKKAGKIQLTDWLKTENLDKTYTAKALIKAAKDELKANAPKPPTPPTLGVPFFGGFTAVTHYGTPSTLDVAMIEEASDEEADWPALPGAVADVGLPAWDETLFLNVFSAHLNGLRNAYSKNVTTSGGQRAHELASTTAPDRRLMDLAWVLDKLDAARTCVAVVYTGGQIRLYANAIDAAMVNDALQVEIAAQEAAKGGGSTFDKLLQRLAEATGPRLGTGEVEEQEKFSARYEKAARRIFKAGMEIAALRKLGNVDIVAHKPQQRAKHAEMRLLDAGHTGLKGAVAISKICCAKCYAAILAAQASGRASIEVQGAHWATYSTAAGWPIPHFLKQDANAMKAFLGDAAYAWYLAYPTEAAAMIEGRSLDVKRTTRTDPYSSDEDEPKKKKVKKEPVKTTT
jgi:hypothetical protein